MKKTPLRRYIWESFQAKKARTSIKYISFAVFFQYDFEPENYTHLDNSNPKDIWMTNLTKKQNVGALSKIW